MPTTIRRRILPLRHVIADPQRKLRNAEIKRCGVCWSEDFTADQFTVEDGIEKCPKCVDHRTEEWKAQTLARETEYAASRVLRPQVSQVALNETMPAIVRTMEDADGTPVLQSNPLRLSRNVAKTLVLKGREFSSADTITASTGITVSVSSRTATQTDLSLTASLSMTPGDLYSLTFNGSQFYAIFSVR